MIATDIVQALSSVVAVGVVVIWWWIGHHRRRVGWYALIPIGLAALVLVFYGTVLLTDANERDPWTFGLLSALIRLIELSMWLAGGLLMRNRYRGGDE